MKSLSRVRFFATLWTVAYQASPSLGFSRQEYWSGLPFPSPGDLPDPGFEPGSPALEADALTSDPPGKPQTSPQLSHHRDSLCAQYHRGGEKHGPCCSLITKSCLTLCNPMDCILLASSVHGILWARILGWVAISFSRGSSQPRDGTCVSCLAGVSYLAGEFFTTEPPGTWVLIIILVILELLLLFSTVFSAH